MAQDIYYYHMVHSRHGPRVPCSTPEPEPVKIPVIKIDIEQMRKRIENTIMADKQKQELGLTPRDMYVRSNPGLLSGLDANLDLTNPREWYNSNSHRKLVTTFMNQYHSQKYDINDNVALYVSLPSISRENGTRGEGMKASSKENERHLPKLKYVSIGNFSGKNKPKKAQKRNFPSDEDFEIATSDDEFGPFSSGDNGVFMTSLPGMSQLDPCEDNEKVQLPHISDNKGKHKDRNENDSTTSNDKSTVLENWFAQMPDDTKESAQRHIMKQKIRQDLAKHLALLEKRQSEARLDNERKIAENMRLTEKYLELRLPRGKTEVAEIQNFRKGYKMRQKSMLKLKLKKAEHAMKPSRATENIYRPSDTRATWKSKSRGPGTSEWQRKQYLSSGGSSNGQQDLAFGSHSLSTPKSGVQNIVLAADGIPLSPNTESPINEYYGAKGGTKFVSQAKAKAHDSDTFGNTDGIKAAIVNLSMTKKENVTKYGVKYASHGSLQSIPAAIGSEARNLEPEGVAERMKSWNQQKVMADMPEIEKDGPYPTPAKSDEGMGDSSGRESIALSDSPSKKSGRFPKGAQSDITAYSSDGRGSKNGNPKSVLKKFRQLEVFSERKQGHNKEGSFFRVEENGNVSPRLPVTRPPLYKLDLRTYPVNKYRDPETLSDFSNFSKPQDAQRKLSTVIIGEEDESEIIYQYKVLKWRDTMEKVGYEMSVIEGTLDDRSQITHMDNETEVDAVHKVDTDPKEAETNAAHITSPLKPVTPSHIATFVTNATADTVPKSLPTEERVSSQEELDKTPEINEQDTKEKDDNTERERASTTLSTTQIDVETSSHSRVYSIDTDA